MFHDSAASPHLLVLCSSLVAAGATHGPPTFGPADADPNAHSFADADAHARRLASAFAISVPAR